MPVSTEETAWAYRMILGREPTLEEAERHACAPAVDVADLRRELLGSQEAREAVLGSEDPAIEFGRRRDRVLEFITPDLSGIEIGPWYNPLCPAAAGYRCMTADVFDHATQVERGRQMNLPPALIELIAPVDFVGSASELDTQVDAKGLLGTFDYVVSSHNFEHIPNPLKFLQACQRVLRPGGRLSMILPDCRASGDYFRAPSATGDILQAWWEGRTHPSPAQIFAHVSRCVANTGLREQWRWRATEPRPTVRLMSQLADAYRVARDHVTGELGEYFDAHCWVFTPTSLRLMMEELRALGLIDFAVTKIVSSDTGEFFVHLENRPGDLTAEDGNISRLARLHEINRETAMRS